MLLLLTTLLSMTLRIIVLCLSVLVGGTSLAASQSTDQSGPMCYDWGEVEQSAVKVLEGEVGWLSCPLFSHPTVYNYTSSQSAGLNLFWYRIPIGQDLEEPIGYSSSSQHLCKERERLWLQPAAVEDTGQYICMLRNKSSCTKIAMRLEVLPRDGAVSLRGCEPPLPDVAVAPGQTKVPLQHDGALHCPDLQDALKMADSDSTPSVTWYHIFLELQRCRVNPFGNSDRVMKENSLVIHHMVERYQGLYYCTINYNRKGRSLNFTRAVNVSAIYPLSMPKDPSIIKPAKDHVYTIKPDTEVHLECRALIPYVEGPQDIGWTIDGKTVEQLSDSRFSKTNRLLKNDLEDLTVESVLVIEDFQAEDLNRELNCTAWNQRGNATRRATLELEVSLPSVELACGLGVTVALMLVLFVVYHVFWLELLLLYRSWFGTDERYTDNKEYDVYISYARNSEEEHFVLNTLRSVLEQELGYTVCIFDRDSLPGGTITDDTLTFVARSRRLLVVLSRGYGERGSLALLELRAGLEGMALGGHLRVILLQYGPSRYRGVSELRRARLALALVQWKGERESGELSSRFWKRLRVELPVRRELGGGGKETRTGDKEKATYRTYESQSSNSSQTALLPPC